MNRLLTVALLVAATVSVPASALTAQQEPAVRYQQAKDLTMRGDWARALQMFRDLSTGDSPQASGAAFYVGVCLENMEGRDPEAFAAYEDMRRRFPDAPMAREALMRQITLAGVIGFSDTTMADFLAGLVDHDDDDVADQAALSLGRLGDERAVDRLVEIMRSGNADRRMMVLETVDNFDQRTADRLLGRLRRAAPSPAVREEVDTLQRTIESEREQRERMERTLKKDVRALIEEIRREGGEWSDEELITHGLFHIMPRDEFVAYVQASTSERERIYREFWEGQEDPNPDTPENELEAEFRRRIDQSRSLFSEPWTAVRSQYDAKEWLTPDNSYSPWDARGELLIKFGEPSDIFIVGNNVEEWYYSHLRVDFTVHKYKLNFLRNAIYPGRVSQQDYPDGFVQARYISSPRIEYWPGGLQ
jgi:hypothetical protein